MYNVSHAHEIFNALEAMMKFARTNGFRGDWLCGFDMCINGHQGEEDSYLGNVEIIILYSILKIIFW